MEFQRRHTPHLVIIVITMLGTTYFVHKQDQMKLRKSAAIAGPSNPVSVQKTEKKKCENREDGYRCYSKRNVRK